jgi:alpha-L-rhamnosidase
MKKFIIPLSALVISFNLHAAVPAPSQLRNNYLTNPLGIDDTQPQLSWIIPSAERNVMQSAYQILVASTPENLAADKGDLWDSGKISTDDSAHIKYAGKPLSSRDSAFWKVRVWTGDEASEWSQPAKWTMGLLKPTDWTAKWIDTAEKGAHAPIKILKATYKSTDSNHSKDVTEKVQSFVRDGAIRMRVGNNELGGDPADGHVKELVVEVDRGGKKETLRLAENSTFMLPEFDPSVKYMRKTFASDKPVRDARLYVTALGLYDIHLNGKRVGDHIIAPEFTDYAKRVRYQAYDVTDLLVKGKNALAAQIANGWYSGHIGNGGFQAYGKIPALLAQLEITFADGTKETVVTDASWKSHPSAITQTDFMLGENYDARAVIKDWDLPTLNDSAWKPVSTREEHPREISSQVMPPVRELMTLKPKEIKEPQPGHWVFDMGQNMVGVARIKVNAPAGTKLTLRHAEMLNPDGTLYVTNLRGAPSIDNYICKGGGEEIWQPRFTFHGFRFVEITGLPEKPSLDTLDGIVLGSDTPFDGSFACSNADINQLAKNILWGQRGNFLSVPTDCPQRDERLGWMGDAQVFIRTATTNADVASFFSKWLVDVDDAQREDGAFPNVAPQPVGTGGSGFGSPAWGDAGVICPWTMYEAYGDKRFLEKHLPSMKRWVDWCLQNSGGLIRDRGLGDNFGDWLSIQADTPKDLIGTAYFAYTADLVSRACEVLGDKEDAEKYRRLFEDIKIAFNRRYVSPDGRVHGNTQCAYVMALKFNLLPDELKPKAVQYLVDDINAKGNHLSTGFVGVSYLLPMLTEGGKLENAYKLLLQDTFPSWLFSVRQGATTIWERWDGWTPEKGFQDPGMNSFNHYSLGSCGEWLFDTVAGIGWDNANPGYKHIVIYPRPGGGFTSAKATKGSMYGPITTDWKLDGGTFSLDTTIPANTTATIILPGDSADQITEGGKPLADVAGLKVLDTKEGNVSLSVGSGTYNFVSKK